MKELDRTAVNVPVKGVMRTIYPILTTLGTLTTAEYVVYKYVPAAQELFSNFPEDEISRQIFAIGLASTFLVSLLAGVISGTRYLDGMAAGAKYLKDPALEGKPN